MNAKRSVVLRDFWLCQLNPRRKRVAGAGHVDHKKAKVEVSQIVYIFAVNQDQANLPYILFNERWNELS
jgi:hypothetical protein